MLTDRYYIVINNRKKEEKIVKFILFICLIVFCRFNTISQKSEITKENRREIFIDSLSKYAYWVTCSYKKSDITQLVTTTASGFFIRRNNRLFFVTAKHAIAELKALKSNNINNPYSITIHFDNISTKEKMEIIVPLSVPQGYKFPGFWDEPDVAIFPIQNYNLPVSSVDELQSMETINYQNIKVCGFPETAVFKPEYQAFVNTQASSFNFSVNKTQTLSRVQYELNKICIFNYILFSEQLSNINTYGYSGGPVFAQDDQTNSWHISGLYSWSEKFSNEKYAAVVVQIKHILAYIDQLVSENGLN